MEVDINELRKRLEEALTRGNTDIAAFIQKEIREVEIMKARLMAEMAENTEDFLSSAAAKIDTYVFQLQEIEKDMHLRNLSLDQETALNDDKVRIRIG